MTFSFTFGPMLPLARGIAIFDEHTRLARFETDNDAPLLAVASPRGAALGTDAIVVLAPHPRTGGGEKLILKRCPNPGLCLKMSHSLNEHPFYFLGI